MTELNCRFGLTISRMRVRFLGYARDPKSYHEVHSRFNSQANRENTLKKIFLI